MDTRETLQIVLKNQLLGDFLCRAGTEERCGRSTRSRFSPEPQRNRGVLSLGTAAAALSPRGAAAVGRARRLREKGSSR